MFYSLFKDLKIQQFDLLPSEVPLVGFNEAFVWPLGRITLLVRTDSVTLPVDFVVMDAPSPYNAILGRTWLHGMKAVASTYHQVVRYVGAFVHQEDLLEDQVASKCCFVNAVRGNKKTS